jgi:hypothetical protein
MGEEQVLNQNLQEASQAVPNKNLIRDIIGTIFDPVKTYKNVLGIGYWVGILIVILLVAAGLEQIYHSQVMALTIQKMQERAGENAGAMQGAMSFYQNEALTRIVFFGSTLIGQIIALLIGTVLYFFVASILFGGTAKFKQVWVVACWGYVIILVQMIIKTPLIMAKRNVEAGLNFGLIFTEQMVGSKLHSAFSAVDLFGIWHFIVVGLGLAVLYKFTNRKGIGIAFIVWLLLTAVSATVAYLT